ncbi:47_t:CDS:1, partial [Funneliformis geosporum]
MFEIINTYVIDRIFKKNDTQTIHKTREVDQGGGTVNEDGISLYSSQTRVELSNEDFNDPKRKIKGLKTQEDELKEEKNKNEILNKLKTLE